MSHNDAALGKPDAGNPHVRFDEGGGGSRPSPTRPALWISSAADQIVATPSAEVGSVGALVVHLDQSERLRKDGITPTIIRSPAAKAEFNSLEPLTAAALEHEQANISRLHHEFVQALARNRGVPANIVLRDFGRGRMMPADAALKTGMIDRIGTFQSVVQGALRQAQQPSPGYAAARSALRQKQSDLARRLRNQQRMRRLGTQRPTRPGAVGTSSALRPKQSDLARRLRNQQRMRQLETHRARGRR
jgi:ClpP class serine protease